MFTGHINQLPSSLYLSNTLLSCITSTFDAIKKDSSLGTKVLIEDAIHYTVVEDFCTAASSKPAEIHQDFIDVHLVLAGEEQIGYSNLPLEVSDETQAAKDLYFGEAEKENFITLAEGEFAVFFPGEVHKPMSSYDANERHVKKVIIKIRLEKL